MVQGPMKITLTASEMGLAAHVGVRRQGRALVNSLQHRHWEDTERKDSWQLHIEAAGAEMAVAKALDLYWNVDIDQFKGPDVGIDIQVRLRLSGGNDLVVTTEDPDAQRYVLVRGVMPTYELVGWCWGHEGKQPKYRYQNSDVHYVPWKSLRDIDGLKDGR